MRSAVRSSKDSLPSGHHLPLPGEDAGDDKPSLAPFHIRWAGIGYGAGLLLVLPLVYWLAEPAVDDAASRPAVMARLAARSQPSQVTQTQPRGEADLAATRVEQPAFPRIDPARERLEAARALIGSRAIEAARVKLQALTEEGHAEALFLLAGTYDPLQLAALGVTTVRAEAERARHLYERALAGGHEPARARLDQLQ